MVSMSVGMSLARRQGAEANGAAGVAAEPQLVPSRQRRKTTLRELLR